jgi:hypothetical protein
MSNKRFNIKCIGCDTVKSEEKVSKIEYHICNNCINRIDMYLQNKPFPENSKDDYNKDIYYHNLNHIKEIIYDNYYILLNCTNCKIAIKRKLIASTEQQYKKYKDLYKNKINLCFDCFENRKDLITTKPFAIRDFFVAPNDLINLRHRIVKSNNFYCSYYNIYYTGDLIKIRDQKYDKAIIAKLIDKRDKLNDKRKERRNIKNLSYELRKKEIITECNNCEIEIDDNDLNNKKIIDYLKKGKKSKHNLNDIIEFLSEKHFLIYNTDFLTYLIMTVGEHATRHLIYIFKYMTYSNIINEIRCYELKKNDKKNIDSVKSYKKKNDITEDIYNKLSIMLNKKQYIDDDNLYSFYFTYIYKIIPNNIKKKLFYNISSEKTEYAEKIAITKIYEIDKKINLPGKLSKMIISDIYSDEFEEYIENYKNINKLTDDIYNKYHEYVKNIYPKFENDFLEEFKYLPYFYNKNIKDINNN